MTQPVKCKCDALFGIEQDDGSLAIKYRDLYRVVKGSVAGPCRKCGAMVEWPTTPYTIPPTVRWTWAAPGVMPPNSYSCNCACSRCASGDCCMLP